MLGKIFLLKKMSDNFTSGVGQGDQKGTQTTTSTQPITVDTNAGAQMTRDTTQQVSTTQPSSKSERQGK